MQEKQKKEKTKKQTLISERHGTSTFDLVL